MHALLQYCTLVGIECIYYQAMPRMWRGGGGVGGGHPFLAILSNWHMGFKKKYGPVKIGFHDCLYKFTT